MKAIIYNPTVANHARAGVTSELDLLKDSAKYAQGIADKVFRTSYLVGVIGGMLQQPNDKAAELLAKSLPLAKDADPEKIKARRAKVKAGEVVEMTKAESAVYAAARKRFSRFCSVHSVKPEGKSAGNKNAAKAEGKADNTPKANNAKTADSYIRQQAATMTAYAEKNRAMLPDAILHAIAEFAECINAVPAQSE